MEEDKENYDQFLSEGERSVLHFVDEERVLENSLPEEDYFEETETEKNVIEEVSKNHQENEIENFQEEIVLVSLGEEENNLVNPEHVEIQKEEELESSFTSHKDEIISEHSSLETILTDIKKDDFDNTEEDCNKIKLAHIKNLKADCNHQETPKAEHSVLSNSIKPEEKQRPNHEH